MTEHEAIEILKNNFPKTCKMVGGRYKGGFDDTECEFGKALLLSISSLEEIQQYRELENRLNKVYGDCDGLLETVVAGLEKHEGAEFEKPIKARLLTDDEVDRWEEYKRLEEQGQLLKLPCTVGDRVFQISEESIEPCTVEVIYLGNYLDDEGNYSNMAELNYDREDCPWVSTEIYFTEIGKTVFLTREEAEKAWKKQSH